jgi:alkanesulfonate monooxygenase SsuD/methylene tetrahydromethanopterin reductase-like flavin-dependent oxidoreductase (luciferase family)
MARLLAVAETDQAAESIARQGAQWLVDTYVNPTKAPNAMAMVTSRHDQSGGTLDPIELYLDGIIIHGTPERVFDQLQQLHEEIWLDYLLCAPLSHSSFLLFTDKVLPRLL